MLSDEPAPGIPFGPRFVYLNTPSINNEGRVAFSGLLQNASRDFSVWSDASGSMTLVARDGDPAVGVGPGVDIEGFAISVNLGGPIFISDVGVAFYANLTGEGADRSGVWAGLPDDLRRVAPLGSPVQGLPAGVTAANVMSNATVTRACGSPLRSLSPTTSQLPIKWPPNNPLLVSFGLFPSEKVNTTQSNGTTPRQYMFMFNMLSTFFERTMPP